MTTIYYPDVSHYDRDRGVTIEDNTVAVVVKATHGTAFVDPAFTTYRQQAQAKRSVFAGYHWLNHGAVQAQAAYYFQHAGKTPCMIDAEDTDKNTGYAGPLTVADVVGFAQALRALGGTCNLVYLPRWYWDQHMGGPSLQPLQDAGLHLVSSDYTTYSDTGPGWNVYTRGNGTVEPSGMRPVVWQYTDNLPYGGAYSDFNAFRGDITQFEALLMGGTMASTRTTNFGLTALDPYSDGDLIAAILTNYDPSAANGKPPINGLQQTLAEIMAAVGKIPTTSATAGAPSQDQVNAAMLNAMLDPRVQKGIGDAIAGHLHVA